MTREEVLEEYQNTEIYFENEEFYEILSDVFLESDNLKELVDKGYKAYKHNNLGHLKDEVYDLPVEGYKNLYDYICSLSYIDRVEVSDTYKQRQDYIDITLKRLGLSGLTAPINSKLLYSTYYETGKSVLDEFFDQLIELIKEEDVDFSTSDLVHIDSIRLAKYLYQKGLIKELRKCTEDVLFQVVDDENNKTVIDVLVENNHIYALPIAGIRWSNGVATKHKNFILDKVIPSLNRTVFEYLLDNNYFDSFFIYDLQKTEDYWKRVFSLTYKIGRLDLFQEIPCEILKWKTNEEDPNSTDYYTALKNNGIKYEVYGEINDVRVAYDYLMEPSANLEYFIKKCSFNIFKSKYKEGSNETIADIFISILSSKPLEEKRNIVDVLYERGWLDEEIINLAYYKGTIIYINNRDFYDIYVGINANHVLDYDIYDGDMKERYEFNVDHLSAEFLKAYENDSDENTLNAIVTSYFAYKETNPVEAQKELQLLIDIKKDNPRFIFKNSTLETQVVPRKKQVQILNCFNLSPLNHELAHLLFRNLTIDDLEYLEKLLPDIKDEKTKEACQSVAFDIIYYIQIGSRTFNYEKKFDEYIKSRFGSVENYKDIMRKEYKDIIGDHQLLADYLAYDEINRRTADMLANVIYEDKKRYTEEWAIEEYVKQRYKTELTTFANNKKKKDRRELLLYENFMDAYYGGLIATIYTKKFKGRNLIMATSTHGEEYFFHNIKRIDEMFANFVALKKLAARKEQTLDTREHPYDGARCLNLIRKNCGEEVYNGLELLYKKALDRIQLDEEITIQDSKRV